MQGSISAGDRLLIDGLYPELRRFAATVGSYDIEPADFVQESLVRTLRTHRLSDRDNPKAYLCRAIVNVSRNQRRSFGRLRKGAAAGRRILLAVFVLVGACSSGTRAEVPTNSGGVLDCTSQTIDYAHFDYGPDAAGSATPADALTVLTSGTGLPPGAPRVETEDGDTTVFVYTDDAGDRLGRASVDRLQGGWVVMWTEHCG